MPVRMRRIASSASTPMTESCGPVMPASVMKAVPPGRTRASAVCTCVWVPTTAVTLPSSQRASAIFSLVASAWTSTSTSGVSLRAFSTRPSTTSNIEVAGWRKSEPRTLITASGVSVAVGTIVSPRPGVLTDVFAGLMTRSDSSRYGPISVRRNAWFPSVIASAPAASSRSARRGVMPTPFAAFSPFTTHASMPSSARRPGRRSSSAVRPGVPTTSATKRIRTRSAIYGTPSVAEGYTWMATFAPLSPE